MVKHSHVNKQEYVCWVRALTTNVIIIYFSLDRARDDSQTHRGGPKAFDPSGHRAHHEDEKNSQASAAPDGGAATADSSI